MKASLWDGVWGMDEQTAVASSAIWKQTPVWSQMPVLTVFSFRVLQF